MGALYRCLVIAVPPLPEPTVPNWDAPGEELFAPGAQPLAAGYTLTKNIAGKVGSTTAFPSPNAARDRSWSIRHPPPTFRRLRATIVARTGVAVGINPSVTKFSAVELGAHERLGLSP